jgi:hypothetical protein
MRRVASAAFSMVLHRTLTNVLTCAITGSLPASPGHVAAAAPPPGPEGVLRNGAALTAPAPFASGQLLSGKPVEISADVTRLALDDDGDGDVTRRDGQRITPGPAPAVSTSRQDGRFGS